MSSGHDRTHALLRPVAGYFLSDLGDRLQELHSKTDVPALIPVDGNLERDEGR
jgi:hypothetical protein